MAPLPDGLRRSPFARVAAARNIRGDASKLLAMCPDDGTVMVQIAGTHADGDRSIWITPDSAVEFAADLLRCARHAGRYRTAPPRPDTGEQWPAAPLVRDPGPR